MSTTKPGYTFGIRDHVVPGEWREDHYTTETLHEVTATHPETGRRYSYCGPARVETKDDARRLIDAIESYQVRTGILIDPASRDYWRETNPVYGSPAWGRDDEAEVERMDREGQEFPSDYNRWIGSIGA